MATKGGKRPGAGRKPKGEKAALPPAPPVPSLPPPKRAKPRQPVVYSDAIADEICARLAAGESLRSICEDEHMPDEKAVRYWVIDNQHDFAPQYARAREIGYERMAEEILEIANTPQIGQKTVRKATGLEISEGDMIEHRRLQVETRKWLLSKMLPKVYGDKQQVEHSGAIDLAAILSARKRSNGQAES